MRSSSVVCRWIRRGVPSAQYLWRMNPRRLTLRRYTTYSAPYLENDLMLFRFRDLYLAAEPAARLAIRLVISLGYPAYLVYLLSMMDVHYTTHSTYLAILARLTCHVSHACTRGFRPPPARGDRNTYATQPSVSSVRVSFADPVACGCGHSVRVTIPSLRLAHTYTRH